jgi:hypothetical protein
MASGVANKMQITLNIVLTMFAVKFSTVQYLPTVACTTFLEGYFVLAIVSISLIMGQNVVTYLINDRETATWNESTFNVVSGGVLGVCWLLSQAVVYTVMTVGSVRRRLVKPWVDGSRFADAAA